jgi:hypothetical protein
MYTLRVDWARQSWILQRVPASKFGVAECKGKSFHQKAMSLRYGLIATHFPNRSQ